jgi:D-alanyl-D-alanine carboxypeptidase/D-alanyl-D-alanine-endopeptidase (penicillin-binding protein 4)
VDVPVPRPAQWFAAALKEALARRGIRVDGAARSVRWPELPAVPTNGIVLGEVSSPPLRELVKAFMKPSQNLEADLIFAHVGELNRTGETPAWRTSEQLAVAALENFLRTNELPASDVHFDEGSGLSRNNLTTANATLALLKFMAAQRSADDFLNSLPLAGVDGTLRSRMKGTPAENNARAKTGTLRWANSLSGHVKSAAGERLVFSLILNRKAPSVRTNRDELDAVVVLLARFEGRSGP